MGMTQIWESARCYARLPAWPDDVDPLAAVMVDWPLAGRTPADSAWVKRIAEEAAALRYPFDDDAWFFEAQVICLRADDTVIGAAFGSVCGTTSCEDAIAIHPDFRRQGYMRECVLAALKMAFTGGRTEATSGVFALSGQSAGARQFITGSAYTETGRGLNEQSQAMIYQGFNQAQWEAWLDADEQAWARAAHFVARYPGHPLTPGVRDDE